MSVSMFGMNEKEDTNYTWEIKNIEDANEWLENLGLDKQYSLKKISTVYYLYKDNKLDVLSRDLDLLLKILSEEKGEKYPSYIVKIKKPVKLKSDRLIKDLESANQWIADIGYDKAIRLDYDGENWNVQVYEEDWKIHKTVNIRLALEEVLNIILEKEKMPKIDISINKVTKLEVSSEKELKIIRSLNSANSWIKSIGKDTEYKFQYAKDNKGVTIQCITKDNIIVYSSKEIEKVVGTVSERISVIKPSCKNTILDFTTLNLWLDTIDFKNGARPYIFRKKTENGNIYSVWDIYKNGGETETKLEFISTSLEISLAYIVITRKLKDYLWDVQLKKESVKKGLNITISSLEAANKWIASLGYKNHLRFNCKERVQNTPNGKVRFPVYFLQERLSGDNWKIVNNTFGKFDDILCLFCKLTKRYKEVPKCTIEFRPQLVEEQKVSEIIQSVKGANIWFDKISIQGCKFRIKSREDKQKKRIYTIEFMNTQGQIGKFYECSSLKDSIQYFCKCYQIKAPAVANI